MTVERFPVIDMSATGKNITRLRQERGLTVRDLQSYFGFEQPQAIYKWQSGKSLPSVDNLYALGVLLDVPLEDILVESDHTHPVTKIGQLAGADCPIPLSFGCFEYGKGPGKRAPILPGRCAWATSVHTGTVLAHWRRGEQYSHSLVLRASGHRERLVRKGEIWKHGSDAAGDGTKLEEESAEGVFILARLGRWLPKYKKYAALQFICI